MTQKNLFELMRGRVTKTKLYTGKVDRMLAGLDQTMQVSYNVCIMTIHQRL